jgi:hypothetical protein
VKQHRQGVVEKLISLFSLQEGACSDMLRHAKTGETRGGKRRQWEKRGEMLRHAKTGETRGGKRRQWEKRGEMLRHGKIWGDRGV